LREHGFSAGEEIDGCITALRPSVNRKMAFRKDHDSGYALGPEPVEKVTHNGGPGALRRFQHHPTDGFQIVQSGRIALIEFGERMSSEYGHL
jgi:hypothetical protein